MENLTTAVFIVWRSWIVRGRCNSEERTLIATRPTLSLSQLQLFQLLVQCRECLQGKRSWVTSWRGKALLAYRISLVRAQVHDSKRCPPEPPAFFSRIRTRPHNTRPWVGSASATSWTRMRPTPSASKKSTKNWPWEKRLKKLIGPLHLARILSRGRRLPRATMTCNRRLRAARPLATSALSLSGSTVSTNRTPKLPPAYYYYTYSCCSKPATFRRCPRRSLLKRQPKNRLTGRITTYQCTKWLT